MDKLIGVKPYNKALKQPSRQLRSQMTKAEQHLWQFLRKDQLGVRFYRQKPILDYIVDFYSPAIKLVIEVDGEYHNHPEQIEQDLHRDSAIQKLGLTIFRFSNNQTLLQVDQLITQIEHHINQSVGHKKAS